MATYLSPIIIIIINVEYITTVKTTQYIFYIKDKQILYLKCMYCSKKNLELYKESM